jgi:basic membrane protein A
MMMKRISWIAILLLCTMLFTVACSASNGNAEVISEEPEEEVSAPVEDTPKVAMLLGGPINDQGWNAMGYSILEQAGEEYGAEISYSENVSHGDKEEIYRNYAMNGFDVILGHSYEFTDAAMTVAAEFPDVIFLINGGIESQAPNMGSITEDYVAQGFLGGATAAILTKTDTVGFVGGLAIPPIVENGDGFVLGAKYVNPDINALNIMTGSFTDAAGAKEIALSMADNGADIIMAQADTSSLGVFEACTDKGIMAIGAVVDQNALAPDTIVTSLVTDFPGAVVNEIGLALSGDWGASAKVIGINDGAMGLAPFHSLEDQVTDEQKAAIEAIINDLADGKIDISSMM